MVRRIHLGTRRPPPPEGADFAIAIDFRRGEPNPQRVFQAADAMIRALQKLDRVLCVSVDSSIEPMMVLEEIEIGSIKIWLRNVLQAVDDQALKSLDWKPVVGKYLVNAKYVYIRWANKSDDGATLVDLAKDLRQIAAETDVKHLPDYAPPSIQELADTARQIDNAKAYLLPGDRITYISPDKPPLDFDLSVSWGPEELSELAIKETTKFPNMPMNLIVKKPDYLGASKWDLRHGRKVISASIDDGRWLKEFQERRVDVRPGDALRCKVTIEHHYGFDNELLGETYTITKVEEVLENQVRPSGDFE